MHFDGIFDIKLKILLESQKNGKNREFLLTFYLSSADQRSFQRFTPGCICVIVLILLNNRVSSAVALPLPETRFPRHFW